jgi:MinD-like ATPase involved in chromosome partitioning or flagellar assembly
MKAAKLAQQRNRPIEGIILNRSKGKYEISLEEVQESTGIPVVAKIKEDDVVSLGLHERVPATMFDKKAAFSKEINKLSNAMLGEKEERSFWGSLFGKPLKKEQVNREILRQSFYKRVFE